MRIPRLAPLINQVEVHILSPEERIVRLEKVSQGYHYGVVQRVKLGTRYFYRLEGNTERPDPASKFQPQRRPPGGVAGMSRNRWPESQESAPPLND